MLFLYFSLSATAQNTTAGMYGFIKTNTGDALGGATIKVIHEPTGTVYFSQAKKTGNFGINNMNPGGPYSIEVSLLNYAKEKRSGIYLQLGESVPIDFVLIIPSAALKNITVSAIRKVTGNPAHGGTETIIGTEKLSLLPSVGRNMYDYLRAVPQVKLVTGNEGAVSIAGQNNRYNAFYVDGAIHNDVFGLAASGTNGGQAGISPLSVDAIDQFQVVVSPYDASLGNFTGGGINAITRSGSNKTTGTVYRYTINENLSGKTPSGLKEDAVKLSRFSRSSFGFSSGGAIATNKLFYFINIDLQRDNYPQPFEFSDYKGNTKNLNTINILSNTLKGNYHYNPGSFLDNVESVNGDRITGRIDWNINNRHKLSISTRYTLAEKMNTNASNQHTIHFSNNAFLFFTNTNSFSVELKTRLGRNAGNKFLLTYTNVKDDRGPAGQAFPRVRINDGAGAFIFGTDNSSTINLLTQKNYTLFDKYNFIAGKHALSVGIDLEYNSILNAFIQNTYGNYTYASLTDFLTNTHPSAYRLGFSLIDDNNNDHTAAAAKFNFLKASFFVHDEVRTTHKFALSYGIRFDYYTFLNKPSTDEYTNQTAIPKFSTYWDLQGAESGLQTKLPPSVSPRIGFTYKLPGNNLVLRGGMGIFTGRIPLAWPGGQYNNNGIFIGGYMADASQLNRIRFRADPYKQWGPAEVGAKLNKEPLNLTSAKFKMPSLFRASVAIDKKINGGWSASIESIFSKNITEINYTNINLQPPAENAVGPDNRLIYSSNNNGKIPLNADSTNPFDYAILLSNNNGKTGYSYDMNATISKQVRSRFSFEASYHFGYSVVLNEGTSSVNVSQWRFMETVNGRNFITRSTSDFSGGHRVFAWATKSFLYPDKKTSISFSLVYTGQSGSPVSYVYGGNSMTRDDGNFGGYDLIYIPTQNELANMVFLPNTVDGITYTAPQQKEALEKYIENNVYLQKNRGSYAERNGTRTPFTHVVDLKIKQDIPFNIGSKHYRIQLTFDMFNFTNFLNRNWGRQYFQPNDNFALFDFAGYVSTGNYNPQYRFNPGLLFSSPWDLSTSATPAYSARWMGQMGIRLLF